ncbi:MAG: hypothetical protein HY369_03430 [Candidatus Aenigmarchaeota archaeon]|nr:hypothetical protein [Candidatus Aenigmarchaeota archaeon]
MSEICPERRIERRELFHFIQRHIQKGIVEDIKPCFYRIVLVKSLDAFQIIGQRKSVCKLLAIIGVATNSRDSDESSPDSSVIMCVPSGYSLIFREARVERANKYSKIVIDLGGNLFLDSGAPFAQATEKLFTSANEALALCEIFQQRGYIHIFYARTGIKA